MITFTCVTHRVRPKEKYFFAENISSSSYKVYGNAKIYFALRKTQQVVTYRSESNIFATLNPRWYLWMACCIILEPPPPPHLP